MVEIRYHDSVADLQAMSAQGPHLRAHSPFDRLEWFALLQNAGLKPYIALASDAEHAIALVLRRENGRLSSLRNWYSFNWSPLSSQVEPSHDLLSDLALDLLNYAHRITFEPVANESGTAHALAHAFASAGWRIEVSQSDTNHYLKLRGRNFSEYWAGRPGALRTTLKRKGKKVETAVADRFTPSAWEQFEQIYAASWKPAEDYPQVLRQFASEEGAAGRLRLGLAFHEGQAVAAQFWTIENRAAYIHKLAHLPSHEHLSVGTTLSAAMFEQAIDADQVDMIDFGTGDEPYKQDWMEETRPRFRVDCLNMKRPRAWIDLARLAVNRSRANDVPMLARLPWGG